MSTFVTEFMSMLRAAAVDQQPPDERQLFITYHRYSDEGGQTMDDEEKVHCRGRDVFT